MSAMAEPHLNSQGLLNTGPVSRVLLSAQRVYIWRLEAMTLQLSFGTSVTQPRHPGSRHSLNPMIELRLLPLARRASGWLQEVATPSPCGMSAMQACHPVF